MLRCAGHSSGAQPGMCAGRCQHGPWGLPSFWVALALAEAAPAPGAVKLDGCSEGVVLVAMDGLWGGICASVSDPQLFANAFVGPAAGPACRWAATLQQPCKAAQWAQPGPGACAALTGGALLPPAQVACRAAGVPVSDTSKSGAGTKSYSPIVPLPTVLANVSCNGNEKSILDCQHRRLAADEAHCELLTADCIPRGALEGGQGGAGGSWRQASARCPGLATSCPQRALRLPPTRRRL